MWTCIGAYESLSNSSINARRSFGEGPYLAGRNDSRAIDEREWKCKLVRQRTLCERSFARCKLGVLVSAAAGNVSAASLSLPRLPDFVFKPFQDATERLKTKRLRRN